MSVQGYGFVPPSQVRIFPLGSLVGAACASGRRKGQCLWLAPADELHDRNNLIFLGPGGLGLASFRNYSSFLQPYCFTWAFHGGGFWRPVFPWQDL